MRVRGVRPPSSRAAMLGSSASSGLPAWALSLALGYALTRPLPLVMHPMRRPEGRPAGIALGHDLMGRLAAVVKLDHLPPELLGEVPGMLRVGHLVPPFSGTSRTS